MSSSAYFVGSASVYATLVSRKTGDGDHPGVIASIVRNAMDERYAYLVSMVVTLVLDIVFSILGAMVVAWFSRAREFRADAGGAALAGRGNMIAALRRLQSTKMLVDNTQPEMATLKISGGRAMMLFATHPPLEDRIRALETARG